MNCKIWYYACVRYNSYKAIPDPLFLYVQFNLMLIAGRLALTRSHASHWIDACQMRDVLRALHTGTRGK